MPRDAPSQPDPISRRRILLGAPALLLAGCVAERAAVLPDIERRALPGLKSHTGWPLDGFPPGLFRNKVALLNFWASWCGYCQAEHPLLGRLEQRLGVPLYGLAFMDKPDVAAAYLRKAGNPFRAAAHDADGRMAKAIGQRGVPTTHVVGHDGRIVASWRGGLSEDGIERVLRPGIAKAREQMAAAARIG